MSLRKNESEMAIEWLGRLLGALIILGAAVFGTAFIEEAREGMRRPQPIEHHEVSYCDTGIVWNEGTEDQMGLFWPCGSIDEVEGAKLPERDI